MDDDSIEVDLYAGTEEPTTLSPFGPRGEAAAPEPDDTGMLSPARFVFAPEVCTLLGGFCAHPACVVCGPIYARWKAVADWRQASDDQISDEVTMVVDAISGEGGR